MFLIAFREVTFEKMIAGHSFDFDKYKILARDIILISDNCYAFQATNPILPGRILLFNMVSLFL